jgi:AcrR family transcriptional regulator
MPPTKRKAPVQDPSPKPRKSELRRQAILNSAVDLFERKGYAHTSLDDVAQAVGIKREALYYYFRSRAEILLAIIRPQSEGLVDGLRQILESQNSSPEKLRLAIRNHLQRFDRHCLEMTVGLRDGVLGTTPGVRESMQKVWKDYELMWTQLIGDGQRDGSFVAAGAPKVVAYAVLGMCNWLARWYDPRGGISIDDLIDVHHQIVAGGLLPRD